MNAGLRRHITRLALGALALSCLGGGPAQAAATDWVGNAHAAARLITVVQASGSAGRIDAGLQIRLAPGWHAYWRNPGDAGVPPSIDWTGSENLATADIAWPAPKRFSVQELETQGYEDGVVLPISVALAHPGAPLTLHAEVDYAACANVCVPYHASLSLALPSGLAAPGPEAPLIVAARAVIPGDLRGVGLRLVATGVTEAKGEAILSVRLASLTTPLLAPDLFIEGIAGGSPGRPVVDLVDGGRIATLVVTVRGAAAPAVIGRPLTLTVVDRSRAAEFAATPAAGALPLVMGARVPVAMVGFALLGGLVLNFMPCVLPVLSLKLLALAGLGGPERRQARRGLLATGAGVIASFAALATALIMLKAAGAAIGWGIQFQHPWFLVVMALATTLFAASLWGWLPIALPGTAYDAVASVRSRSPLRDAFLAGVFATLMATSCSAPFVGTALGFALARGPFEIALIFAALGVGMAAPLLLVAGLPALVRWLPRPGPWMAWLRRALGLALLGTAAWLVSILGAVADSGSAIFAAATLGVLLAALGWRSRWPHGHRMRRASGAIAALLGLVAVATPALRGEAVATATPDPQRATGLWQPFALAEVHRLVSEGRLVFVNVTADWCLTCKLNELNVLDRAPVRDLLGEPGVVAMRADWTRPDPAVTAYLQSFGRYGVPLDVVYGPAAPDGIKLPELLTTSAVLDAFARAGNVGIAAR
jgi:suppressor for copper-sensitivity B